MLVFKQFADLNQIEIRDDFYIEVLFSTYKCIVIEAILFKTVLIVLLWIFWYFSVLWSAHSFGPNYAFGTPGQISQPNEYQPRCSECAADFTTVMEVVVICR